MKIITISGNSTSGKSTLERMLVDGYHNIFEKAISHTTRDKRNIEICGEDYYFVTEEIIKNIDMLEHEVYNGKSYGISTDEIMNILSHDKIPIIVLTPTGVIELTKNINSRTNAKIYSFYLNVSKEMIKQRLSSRLDDNLRLATNINEVKDIHYEHESRIISILNEEKKWKTQVNWTKTFSGFSSETETSVINDILNYIK